MEITIHTGLAGSQNAIHIDWFDENNVHHAEELEINIEPFDKSRALAIILNTVVLANINSGGMTRN